MSTAKSVMPIEPNGTRPISILRPESRSQSSDPVPIPKAVYNGKTR